MWELIEKCFESADTSNEIIDGRVYKSDKPEDTIWRIYVEL